MKKLSIAIILFFCFSSIASGQQGMWTWLNGDSIYSSYGVFGTQGVSDSTNTPPAFYEACQWTDLNGNFWLFGGEGPAGTFYSDLWEYNPSSNKWTWMKGKGVSSDTGYYSATGVAAAANNPCSRACSVSWVDLNGDLWLYGGVTFGGNSIKYNGGCSDLWKYNIASNMWTLVKGNPVPNSNFNEPSPVYGIKGTPSLTNTPSVRWETDAAWVDNKNNLWLFGGVGNNNTYNDLWKYNISTNEWVWMSGSDSVMQPSVFGIKGVADSSNVPGARAVWCSWKDFDGNFWMFGGSQFTSTDSGRSGYTTYYNDVWRFNPSNNNWTWMAGDAFENSNGSKFTNKCDTSYKNNPSSRFETRAHWVDDCGNFWLFGGNNDASFFPGTFNDLWCFNPINLEWALVSGDNYIPNISPSNGVKGAYSANNNPGSRYGAIAWFRDNRLYLFGGFNPSTSGNLLPRNDLWKYTIDPTCPAINHADASITQSANTLTANASGALYQWIDCNSGKAISGATNESFVGTSNGNYEVMVTYKGCVNTSICYDINMLGVSNYGLTDLIQIFPNPANNELIVDWKTQISNMRIIVNNICGKTIPLNTITSLLSAKVDVSQLVSGIYLICLENMNTGERIFKKFVKSD